MTAFAYRKGIMKIRVMSSNIWGDYFNNPVEARGDQLAQVYTRYSPDVLALQEATPSWYASRLFSTLRGEYEFAAPSDAPENNYTPLLYRREMFDCIDQGFVRFPETPDISKGAAWVLLLHRESGKKLAVFSTHFWWKFIGTPEHDALRVANAEQLSAKAEELNLPVIAMGDLNSRINNPSIETLRRRGWKFARDEASITTDVSTHHGDPVLGSYGKYHGARSKSDYTQSIDHIFYRGALTPERFAVVEDQDALDATDHSPIWCDFIID